MTAEYAVLIVLLAAMVWLLHVALSQPKAGKHRGPRRHRPSGDLLADHADADDLDDYDDWLAELREQAMDIEDDSDRAARLDEIDAWSDRDPTAVDEVIAELRAIADLPDPMPEVTERILRRVRDAAKEEQG